MSGKSTDNMILGMTLPRLGSRVRVSFPAPKCSKCPGFTGVFLCSFKCGPGTVVCNFIVSYNGGSGSTHSCVHCAGRQHHGFECPGIVIDIFLIVRQRSESAKLEVVTLWAEWQSGYAAACKAVYLGSIPGSASKILIFQGQCPGGEIGRRKGLKIPRGQPRVGSSPTPGTML